jgi:hypothetical protein
MHVNVCTLVLHARKKEMLYRTNKEYKMSRRLENTLVINRRQDISDSIAADEFMFTSGRARDLSLLHIVHTGSGAHSLLSNVHRGFPFGAK